MPILNAVLGAVLLFFGRTLYWLFVAVAGFFVVGRIAQVAMVDQPAWVQLAAAVIAGAIGAFFAIVAQRLAFAIGGFYAGGYLALHVAQSIQQGGNEMIWFVIGGAVGALVAAMILDWAIIVLSSLAGAIPIVALISSDPTVAPIVYLLLVAVGVFVQAKRLRAAQGVSPPPRASNV